MREPNHKHALGSADPGKLLERKRNIANSGFLPTSLEHKQTTREADRRKYRVILF